MNFSTIALAILAWKIFSDSKQEKKAQTEPKIALTDLLNDDVKTVLMGAETLTSKDTNADEKMSAIISLASNPTVMNLAQNLFGQKSAPQEQQEPAKDMEFTNDEGYKFDKPSDSSMEFFRPIDRIADAEVKSKLYWFYDNWYL